MSTYYDMSISHNLCIEIEMAIMTAIEHSSDVQETIENVHLLDVWEELQVEASNKNNAELHRWLEQQKLFEKRDVDDIFMFHSIKSVIKENELDLDLESEFYLICDLADLFKKKMEETTINE